jgi:hypothetical protein
VTPVVSLGPPATLQDHGPIAAAALLIATELCLRTVAPSVGGPRFVSQAAHT